ncbi:hypothetical protein AZ468_23650 (plasmid) [Vibrio europaeus]|jgi:hypothetical protein|uniref:Uncharacterized protein n=1 Tax=Vibrio europaeus TaxID=300876 RepID=A0A178J3S0_9VIBR|nr:hypothetical protein AZ468_23650 [Vibrio europaeus]
MHAAQVKAVQHRTVMQGTDQPSLHETIVAFDLMVWDQRGLNGVIIHGVKLDRPIRKKSLMTDLATPMVGWT